MIYDANTSVASTTTKNRRFQVILGRSGQFKAEGKGVGKHGASLPSTFIHVRRINNRHAPETGSTFHQRKGGQCANKGDFREKEKGDRVSKKVRLQKRKK